MQLSELGFVGRGKSKHRPRNDASLYKGAYPFIQTGDVKNADLWLTAYSQTYNEKGLAQSKLWPKGTLCITIAANIAETAILGIEACFPDSIVGFISNPSKADVRYVKYYIDTIKLRMQNISRGTTQDNLSVEKLLSFDFSAPRIEIQQRIADILSAYDDLIENNTRRIKILEQMAQMLYREWFVNFRFPGHEKVQMVGSEIGICPDGWCQQFSDYVDFLEGPGLRRWQYHDSGLRFLNIRTIANGDIDFTKTQFIDAVEAGQKYKHFLLSEFDHVVSSSGTLGRIVTVRQDHLPLMLNTSVIRMRPRSPKLGRWHLKGFLRSDYFQNQIVSFASGAAQMNFGPSHLKEMKILAPPSEISGAFEAFVTPIELLICSLTRKNSVLRNTRDLLLHKLVSGEISVEQAERKAVAQMA